MPKWLLQWVMPFTTIHGGNMIAIKLTGNTRYRIETRWFKEPLVVLQVEVHRKGYETLDAYGYYETRDVDECIWRDARLQDLKVMK